MNRTIDEKVVSMKFNNKDFEKNVQHTLTTLEKLKSKLNFKESLKGFEQLDKGTKKVDFSKMQAGVEAVRVKFSALEVVGLTTLTRITNKALDAGKSIANALTIDPIKTGLQEYETQINAIQTILANTESKGTNLTQVNAALDELNTYADKTIYNFTEMTRNIGTFTAAGVDLKTSVSSIKGIANLAAVSGSTSQQASVAMYQLSQALAAGKVQLMDWNSVVNAGMGGEVFQNALKRTATHMGKNVDALIKKYGSFRESLTQGNWLTTQVLTETLTQLSGAYSKADLIAQGYNEKQAEEITKLAETAVNAATKVKTVSQLWDTLKEAAQSGWTQSWEIMIGDFDEAKELLTNVSDSVGAMIQASADKRNKLLGNLSTGYKQFVNEGIDDTAKFDETFKQVAKDHGIAIDDMVTKTGSFEKACQQGWVTGDMLKETVSKMVQSYAGMSAEQRKSAGVTESTINNINELNNSLQNGSVSVDDFAKKFNRLSGRQNVISGITSALQEMGKYLSTMGNAFKSIFPDMKGETLYQYTVKFKEFCETLSPTSERLDYLKRTFEGLFSILDIVKKAIESVGKAIFNIANSSGVSSLIDLLLSCTAVIGDFFTALDKGFDTTNIDSAFTSITNSASTFVTVVSGVLQDFTGFIGKGFKNAGKILGDIADGLGKIIGVVSENFSISGFFAGLFGYGAVKGIGSATNLVDSIKDFISNAGNILDEFKSFFNKDSEETGTKVKDLLGNVSDSLKAFTKGINVTSMVAIAASIGILTSSLKTLSKIKMRDTIKGLTSMGILFTMLNKSFGSISKILGISNPKGIVKSTASLILIAESVKILGKALTIIANIDSHALVKSLLALPICLKILTKSLDSIQGKKVSLSSMTAIVVLSKCCKTLVTALASFGKLSWGEITHGLVGMGGALLEMSGIVKIMDRFIGKKSLVGSVSLVIAVKSLKDLSKGLFDIGSISWNKIKNGLVGLGGALSEVAIINGLLGKFAKGNSIKASVSLVIAVKSLNDIAQYLKDVSLLSWEEIAKGLASMGGALTELGLVSGILGKVAKSKGLIGAGAIVLAVQSLEKISKFIQNISFLSWDDVNKGLYAMLGTMSELALVVGILGKVAGLSGILGSGTILLAVQSLADITKALKKIGSLNSEQIKNALIGLGGALTELGVVSGLLGKFTGLSGLLGAGTLIVGISGLNDLAEALQKFASLSWYQIDRGLGAMEKALGDVAIGSLLNTFSGIGAFSISKVVKPLSDLADSVKKWEDVYVSPNLRPDLINLAEGVKAFTLGGFGADAIATLAKPLGDLAASASKWKDVIVSTNVKADMANLAIGVKAFTLAGFGSNAIATVAEPLGVLADSVKKWKDVTVSPNIKPDLVNLADGVKAFTLAGFGANAIANLCNPLSVLADSVKKWQNTSVSPNIKPDLINLADGVKAFTFAAVGGFTIDLISKPLGNLADSVNKWKDIYVSPNIKADLTNIADGIKAFTFAGMGGFSIDMIAKPLGTLASNVSKWKDVYVSPNTKADLTNLADGIKAFTFAGLGGFSISAISEPLGTLADSVKKWENVIVSTNIKPDLTNLATGIKAFTFAGAGADVMVSIATPLGTLADSVSKWSTVTLPEGLPLQMSTLATSLRLFADIGDINGAVTSLSNVVSNLEKLNAINIPNISSGLVGLSSAFVSLGTGSSSLAGVGSLIVYNILNPLESCNTRVTNAVNNLMNTISTAANNSSGNVKTTFKNVVNQIIETLTGLNSKFETVGQKFASSMAKGINTKRVDVVSTVANMSAAASGAIGNQAHYNSFYSNGAYLIQGIINGMNSKKKTLVKAASELSTAAIQASAKAFKERSPSRIGIKIGAYFGEGQIIGILNKVKEAKKAGSKLANASVEGVQNTMSQAKALLNNTVDSNLMFTPDMDISNVRKGFSQIDTMFGRQRALALAGSINLTNQQQSLRETVDTAVNSALNKINELNQNEDNSNVTIEVPVNLNGKEVARITAPYTKKEIDKIQTRNDRKRGIL